MTTEGRKRLPTRLDSQLEVMLSSKMDMVSRMIADLRQLKEADSEN